jgi:hypothetical protein
VLLRGDHLGLAQLNLAAVAKCGLDLVIVLAALCRNLEIPALAVIADTREYLLSVGRDPAVRGEVGAVLLFQPLVCQSFAGEPDAQLLLARQLGPSP